jgi:PTH1 family peptidyl-tRNA hydrolase
MDAPLVIAGLGNPGREYAGTRHNAGFLVLDRLAARWGLVWEESRRFQARVARVRRGGRVVWLCEPQTYMNLSGESVGPLLRYHQVPVGGLVVVVDDADLPLGTVRMRPRGSSGGHHGLESVEQQTGSREFARQRLGIGRRVDGAREITGHVLGRFAASERGGLERMLGRAVDQLECWAAEGVGVAMQRFNGTDMEVDGATETK